MAANNTAVETKARIEESLKAFRSGSLDDNAVRLLDTLGYRSDKTLELEASTPEGLLREVGRSDFFSRKRARPEEWGRVDFLFQLTDEEVRGAGQPSFGFDSSRADVQSDRLIESYIFFAVELKGESYSRTVLADITREINRLFPMPALIIFRHGQVISLSVIDRRLSKRDASRDVLEKVTLVKDIRFADPLRAHIDILNDLALPVLQDEFHFHNFVGLHQALRKRLDTDALNKQFYCDVANWYFWALDHDGVTYPRSIRSEEDRSIFLIRLLTRLIFCWFLQEKALVPRDVFRRRFVEQMLKDFSPGSGSYYRAFLQNLFFATLNQEPGRRGFRKRYPGSRDGNRGATTLYRYADLLKDPEAFESKLSEVPFVNGGLFDCLDDVHRQPNVRLDDFSEELKNGLHLPNELFFGEGREVDLTDAYGDSRRRRERVRGLIDILSRYKFTVEESTPLEQEVALDPELLGRVFENLLASYNEDTRTTARKATGSFYTPREIVGYMVDEALASYFETALKAANASPKDAGRRLRQLFSAAPSGSGNPFSDREIVTLVAAIDRVKILDPACGSGAFLMGALQRLVDLLQKLDPANEYWRALQHRRAVKETDATFNLGDKEERKQRLDDINEVFEQNTHDYGRKLYLIENCIYGVDIQPIACQIAKLRFFISLIVDQSVNRDEKNFGVRPLPNLEAKVVAADTLVPVERPAKHQYVLLDAEIQPLRQRLGEVRHKYFLARSPATKAKCRERDIELRREIAGLLRETGWSSRTAKQMADWDPYDQNSHATFFDPEWMFGLSAMPDGGAGEPPTVVGGGGSVELAGQQESEPGFDIVIGNPPYIRLQTLKQKDPDQVVFFKDTYESARKGNYDVYVVFVERGMQLLKPTGSLAYILPHKFFNAQYGEPLRDLLSRGRHLNHVVHFGDQQVFPGATNYVCLLFLSKQGTDHLRFVKVDDLREWLTNRTGAEAEISPSKITSAEWNFAAGKGAEILERLESTDLKLSGVADRMFQGSITSADTVFLFKQFGTKTERTTEVFSKELQEWVTVENGLLKQVVRSGDIGRYYAGVEALVLFPYEVRGTSARLYTQSEMEQRFPMAWQYFNRNRELLQSREHGKFNDSEWYRFGRTQNLGMWEQTKLMVPYMITNLSAYLDEDEHLYFINVTTGGYGITIKRQGGSLKFLCGLLNSRVLDYYLKHVSTNFHGGYFAANKQFIEQLPIPTAKQGQQSTISLLVEYLLWLNRHAKLSDENNGNARDPIMAGYFEQIINGLVYELFFSEELHAAGLYPFRLVEEARFPNLDDIPEARRLTTLRQLFERLYDTKHPLRGCLYDIGSLETVRIIEGRE